jgi:short-subunit dehydrogenase
VRAIRDKVAVITGAGSGLGRAIALRLAREGAHLHLVDINQAAAEQTAAEASSRGVRAVVTRCDLTNPQAIDGLASAIIRRWGAVDILVNNAGIGWYGRTNEMSSEAWDRMLAVNLHAPIRLTTKLLRHLVARPEAHVINMASICGWVCAPRFAAYHVSKFGLVGFSEALRAEFGRRGLGVTAVCPGPVRTTLFDHAECGYQDRQVPLPPAWMCTTAERVAEKTIRAIYRNQAVAVVGASAQLLYYAKRFAPWMIYALHNIGRGRSVQQKLQEQATHSHRRAA